MLMIFGLYYQQKNKMKGNNRGRGRGDNDDTRLSKAMSYVLRHGAVQQGIKIDAQGYVHLDELIKYLKGKGHKNVDEERIRHIVDTNEKKRFQLEERKHHIFIRATQGHSIKQVETQQLLTQIKDPTLFPTVVHGTYLKFWGSIRQQGLKRMNRNHIHFAPGFPKEQGVVSGMRTSCDIIIQIDLGSAMDAGIKFFISSNHVILTQGDYGVLPPRFFKRVTNRQGQLIE